MPQTQMRQSHALLLIVSAFLRSSDVSSFVVVRPTATSRVTSTCNVKCGPLYDNMLRSIVKRRAAGQKRPRSVTSTSGRSSSSDKVPPVVSVEFLDGVTKEALYRSSRILESLKDQEKRSDVIIQSKIDDSNITSLEARRLEIEKKMEKLRLVQRDIQDVCRGENSHTSELEGMKSVKSDLINLGFQSLLSQGPDSWRHVKDLCRKSKEEFGRPADFDGLLFFSPHGVPILVGRKNAHSDDVLRRISQGSDLWFQVEDYEGSRVLLRSSLMRGLKDSRDCKQKAADLASYFSNYKRFASVPIMYTDSRRVAKRGSKKGTMRKRKSLGTMYGNPINVKDECKGKEF